MKKKETEIELKGINKQLINAMVKFNSYKAQINNLVEQGKKNGEEIVKLVDRLIYVIKLYDYSFDEEDYSDIMSCLYSIKEKAGGKNDK